MLYLVKSSRYREFQQEVLQLLAGRTGTTRTARYGRGWIDADLAGRDLAGLPAVLALAEEPFERCAVLRLARVTGWRDEGDRLELQLALGGYPQPDFDQSAFDAWFADRHAGRERPDYVFLDPDGVAVAEQSDLSRREEAWRAAVDRLLASDAGSHYSTSTFLLPAGLQDLEAAAPVEPEALVTGRAYGQQLACYAPQLEPSELARRSLGLAYDRSELELLDLPGALPAGGRVELRLRVLVPGSARLQLFVRPGAERSTRLALDLHAAGEVTGRQAACQEMVDETVREELRSLLALLRKHGALASAELERQVLDHLLALAPEDPELIRQLAWHLHRAGDHAGAEQRFAELGPGRLAPDDWLPYFLSACRCQCAGDALADILGNLPWDQLEPAEARQIGRCVAGLPERVILSLLEALAYFGTERFLQDIWQELRPAIRTADGVLQTYHILRETHLDTPEQLYTYLAEQTAALDLIEPRFDERMVEDGLLLDSAPPGFDGVLLRHLGRLVDGGRHEEALVALEQARSVLGPAAFDVVRIELAGGLAETAGEAELALAGRLFADAAESARVRGDLDEAAVWLERAALADPGGERLAAVQAAVERAVEAAEPVHLLTEALFSQRVKQLRDRLAGSRLTIVGGPHEKPWVGELRHELALSDVNWFISDMGKPPRPDKIREALGRSTGAVAVLTFHVGHRAAEVVREEARKRDIPCAPVFSGTSKNALLKSLFKAVLDEPAE